MLHRRKNPIEIVGESSYCKALHVGLPLTMVWQLLLIQNVAARLFGEPVAAASVLHQSSYRYVAVPICSVQGLDLGRFAQTAT